MPAIVTPRSGTGPDATWPSSTNENANVAVNEASTNFCRRSRYHRRMNRGDNVPVAICTTSTPIVTTRPIRPTMAATTADRTALAVEAE